MAAHAVTEQRVNVGLIEHRPMLDAVAEALRHDARVIGEFVGDIALEPAALVLQRLRQIPVVEAKPRGDAAGDETVDQTVVEIKAAMLNRARARGQDARPRGREPVGIEAAARQPFDVLDPAMIVVAGNVAVVVVFDEARGVRKRVPDALAAPVLVDRALDLIARGRRTPDEIGREGIFFGFVLRPLARLGSVFFLPLFVAPRLLASCRPPDRRRRPPCQLARRARAKGGGVKVSPWRDHLVGQNPDSMTKSRPPLNLFMLRSLCYAVGGTGFMRPRAAARSQLTSA